MLYYTCMKKYLPFFTLLLVLLAFPLCVIAQSGTGQSAAAQPAIYPGTMVPPVPVSQNALPFGQNHFYTLTLRGNGDVYVSLKMIFSNKEEASLSAVKLTFPADPNGLSIYQAIREPQCIQYKPAPMPLGIQSGSTTAQNANQLDSYRQPECEAFQEPDYQYGWGQTTYQKAKYTINNKLATIMLPKEIKPGGTGSLIIVYDLPGITANNIFGAYSFSYETIKVVDTIQNMQVGITVDPEYYLKDAKGNINYQSKEAAPLSQTAPAVVEGVYSPQFDQYYSQIGQGTIIKTATNIQPNQSFTVEGMYADSRFKLYAKELLSGIGIITYIIIISIVALYWGIKRLMNKTVANPNMEPSQTKLLNFFAIAGVSFGSSFFIIIYTITLYILSYYFSQTFQYYSYNVIYPILLILLGVISLSIYAICLFVPAIIIGIRRGMLSGVLMVVLTIFWLIINGIIIAVLFVLFFQKSQSPYPPQPFGVMRSNIEIAPNASSGQTTAPKK